MNTKYKIHWIKKHNYRIVEHVEDGEEIFLRNIYEGNLNECEIELKRLKNENRKL